MNVITKIGTVSNINYTSKQVTEEIRLDKLTFTLEYAAGRTVAVECQNGELVNEIRGKLKEGEQITMIGLLEGSIFDKNIVICGVSILTEDERVYPKCFGKDLALQYRQKEREIQKLLRVSEQFSDEDDPF